MALEPSAEYGGQIGRIVAARPPLQVRLSERVAWAVVGAGLALYGALQFWLTRGTTMFIDEYTMFLQNHGLRPSALLAPFNEHLELARRLLYAVGFPVLGADGAFLAAKFVQAASVIALVVLVFVFLKRRIGAAAALAPTLLLLFFGSAWELNFGVSGIGNVLALAAGTAALITLDRRGRRVDMLACVLLVVSVLSFTTGVAFAVGALCLIAGRHEWRARAWVALVPIALYAVWLLWVRVVYLPGHPGAQAVTWSNVLLVPNMVAQQAAATAGALAGLNYDFAPSGPLSIFYTSTAYGTPIAAAAGALLLWRLRRGASPLLWALVATLVAYWIELALGAGLGRTPATVRYTYAAGVLMILIAGEAVNKPVTSTRALAILYAVTAFALVGNAVRLHHGMRTYRTFGTTIRAQLSAIEIAAPAEQPSFTTGLGSPPLFVGTAGPYLAAVHRNGSPAYGSRELLTQSETLRALADGVLLSALRLHLTFPNPGQPVGRCRRLAPGSGAAPSLALGPPGAQLRSSATARVALGRYAPGQMTAVGTLPAGRPVDLRIPRDRSALPWRMAISPASAIVTVCDL